MASIRSGRQTAALDGDIVVFLIGMRINAFWKPHKWLPVFLAMPRMLSELEKTPGSGLLHWRLQVGIRNFSTVQYWRSFDELHRYASAPESAHLPAWRAFNRAIGSNGDVGIWHETYLIRAADCESVYVNMPPFGLGAATRLVPAEGRRKTAKQRLSSVDEAAVESSWP